MNAGLRPPQARPQRRRRTAWQTLSLLALTATVACTASPPTQTRPPGSDRDTHGCIPSAGYTWSALRGQCLRIFEAGIALHPVSAPKEGASLVAYVLTDGQTPAQAVELFLPGSSPGQQLRRETSAQGAALVHPSKPVRLRQAGPQLVLEINGQTQYTRPWAPDLGL